MKPFWQDVLSDADSHGSFSRVATIPIVLVVCFILAFYVCWTKHLPTIPEAAALALVAGCLYCPNQLKTLVALFRGNTVVAEESEQSQKPS